MIKALSMFVGSWVIIFIPRKIALSMARMLGPVLKIVLRSRTQTLRHNLQHLGCTKERAIAELYGNMLYAYFDILRFPHLSKNRVRGMVTKEGEDLLRAQLEKGGVLVVTPHLGNWELGGAYFGLNGYPACAVAETIGSDKSSSPGLTSRLFRKFREKTGLEQVALETPLQLLRSIRDKKMIILLGDRDITGTGKEFDFLDSDWKAPLGPALMALKTRTPIFTGYVVLEKENYRGFVEGPVPFEDLDYSQEGMVELTSRVLQRLEGYIRAYPTQWFVFEKLIRRDTGP